MTLRQLYLSAGLLFSSSAAAVGSNTIATDTFEMTAPAGWVVDLSAEPVSATSSSGDLLQISSYSMPGPGQGSEADDVRKKVTLVATSAITMVIEDPALKVTSPLGKIALPNGSTAYEVQATLRDGSSKFAQWVVVGNRSILLITVDTETDAGVAAAKAAVNSISWR